ncbi:hypothetical protein PR202_ga17569 [Eleusine coracana subsp. coracana]|uniref:U-box domain-containing protein n=1 Tax=Eleusine coracana subsp. coracana TaxID=191504 RepID=A0AAV5CQY9_ELECO|nr:hypothetical protein PR202_ga17322 [Eleusine coracana subsp. coracana]GJN00390.1 hypothetical protein PR202_ga17569 [Eleusine coracana subsp. coracana]
MSRATRPVSRLVPEIPLLRRSSRQQVAPAAREAEEVSVPAHFRCPISLDLMRDPVTVPTGITYDRESVEGWLARGNTTTGASRTAPAASSACPRRASPSPTPTPPTRSPTCHAPARRGDSAACGAAAARARALGKESERNRRCLAAAGAARALAAAFARLAGEGHATASGEILAALTVFFPLDGEARRCITASLTSLVSVMSRGELAARTSAAIVLREVASSADSATIETISKTPSLCDALVGLVRSPISSQATKAALVTAYYLVAASDAAAAQLARIGFVPVAIELLVDADKGTSEKALAALDGVLRVPAGRAAAAAHALAVPVLVKKVFRVSDMATDFAVSALWRLCRDGDESCRAEALRVGAFQKLLLLLQVGCGGVTKERASDLLKLLNGSRGSVECIETVDFKGLKRPF